MQLRQYSRIYLIGIGGIGMSALARYFAARGCAVAGYDRTPTPLTAELQAEGIHIHFEDNPALIDESYLAEPARTLIVYTPAIPADCRELAFFRAQPGLEVMKRSQVLGLLTRHMPSIAVAGTHGKTTTSAMIAHLLHQGGIPELAFIGGITRNYGSNLIMPDGEINSADAAQPVAVVEADEFDRSFLQLYPDVAVFTSLDPDHLDIYGTAEEMLASYRQFASQVKLGGRLIVQHSLVASLLPTPPTVGVITYGLEAGEARAERIRAEGSCFIFDLIHEDFTLRGVRMQVPGYHNVENAVAAACATYAMGLGSEQVQAGLESFAGVQRRFEFVEAGPDHILIDDYAHHPTEIEALLRSVRGLYPGRHITVIFQPHLFTRTRDFAAGFATSLSAADRVVLLDIYPARELPIPGITADTIGRAITAPERHWSTLEGLPRLMSTLASDVVLIVGAGDISTLVYPVSQILAAQPKMVVQEQVSG